ncbi:MAG: holo-[acyl-carrier-protein] synthase [Zetaproteobacteria bacterium]|nr:MAG: holo-[acyl-carrier-protein] synthase [Zetaproteobacteria bacterium]
MIIGIGVDRLTIERVRRAADRFGPRFRRRIFTREELRQADAKGDPERRLAMLFAAKEAVAKALGTGFRGGVTARSIETIHLESGAPQVRLHDGAARAAARLGVRRLHLSLTDEAGVAIAFAIAEHHDG